MKVRAKLSLISDSRKTPFKSGYRPLFNIAGFNTSGRITLINQSLFYPGETGEVEIDFLSDLGSKIQEGMKIIFHEGMKELGTAEVIEVLKY